MRKSVPVRAPSALNYKVDSHAAQSWTNLIKGLWDAESLGIAVADATPAGDGEQQCAIRLRAAARELRFPVQSGDVGLRRSGEVCGRAAVGRRARFAKC